jgi:protein-tyrosine phosphatase
MASVLFVCLGNICRSPLAEGVFRYHVENGNNGQAIEIDSAGTGSWHIGNAPDPRSIEVATKNGIDISHQRARRVRAEDFDDFDHIIAMDIENKANLNRLHTGGKAEISLFLSHAPHLEVQEVPDPYYGGDDGFDHVFSLVDEAAKGLLANILDKKGEAL